MSLQDEYLSIAHIFTEKVLEKYSDRIESIILFGSVARGETTDESDIDILVIGEISLEQLIDISYPLLLKHKKYISPKDMEKTYFDELYQEEYSFVKNIVNEGVVLYERVAEASG
jgi:predicted nucleotidyltransferase